MIELTIEVNGMACAMCESHINDAVRRAAKVKKVTSSRKNNSTVVIADDGVDEQAIISAIRSQGYETGSVSRKPYEKHGLFSRK